MSHVAPTCVAGKDVKKCSRCSAQQGTDIAPVQPHQYTVLVSDTATCAAAGIKTYKCANCSATTTKTSPAKGHDFSVLVSKTAPTCQPGQEVYKCSRCGETRGTDLAPVQQHSYTILVSDTATCTAAGVKTFECAKCSARTTQASPAKGHDFSITVSHVDPTCVAGKDVKKCSRCSAQQGTDLPPVQPHSYTITVSDTATCTEAGTKVTKCAKCGTTMTSASAALGHDYSILVKKVEPTCVAGTEVYKCSRCSATHGTDLAPVHGHTWEVTEKIAATTEKEGKIVKTCSSCGLKETETLPILTEEPTTEAETEPESKPLKNLVADPSSLTFTENSDSRQIKLLNLVDDSSVKASVQGDAGSWIKVGGSGDTYTIRVATNEGSGTRKGVVTFIDSTNGRSVNIEVTQSKVKGCTIIFDANHGQGQYLLEPKSAVPDSKMAGLFPTAQIKAPVNKAFDGWYTDPKAGVKFTEESKVPKNTEILKLYAHWIDKEYVIEYVGNGADSGSMSNTKAVCNKYVDLPENKFVNNGFIFECWNTKSDGSGKSFKDMESVINLINLVDPNAEPGSKITLYARWVRPTTVKVNLVYNGGTAPGGEVSKINIAVTYKMPYGDIFPDYITAPEGKVFAGWVLTTDRGIVPVGYETGNYDFITKDSIVHTAKDHTLVAIWKDPQYKIHFDGNRFITGSTDDIVFKPGEKKYLPECGFDEGKKFDCWGTKADGSGYNFKAGTPIQDVVDKLKLTSENGITLYALWYEHEYKIEYWDGFTKKHLYTAEKSEVSHRYTPYNAPEIPGLTFVGWSTTMPLSLPLLEDGYYTQDLIKFEANRQTVVESDSLISKTIKVYSIYKRKYTNKYSVIYYPDFATGVPETEYYGGPGVKPISSARPEKTGYTFVEWSFTDDGYGSAQTVELTDDRPIAVVYPSWIWGCAKVTLDYGYDGKMDEIPMLMPGESYRVSAIERDDYVFDGWKAPDGTVYQANAWVKVPDTGITLTAKWTRRSYKIVFRDWATGSVLGEKNYISSETVDFIPETPMGVSVAGWYADSKKYRSLIKPGTLVSVFVDMGGKKDTYYLSVSYEHEAVEAGMIIVCYDNNRYDATGGPTQTGKADITAKTFTLSSEEPTSPTCDFKGWSYNPDGGLVYPKGTEAPVIVALGHEYIQMFGSWKSKYKCVLDMNDPSRTNDQYELSDVLPGDTVHLYEKNIRKAVGERDGYHLAGWGTTKDRPEYGEDSYFTVPAKDFTLYAIWERDETEIILYDKFSKITEIGRIKAKVGDSILLPEVAPDVPGYDFTGWAFGADDMSEAYYHKGEEITVPKGGLVLYSAYEKLDSSPYMFTITYVANGGTGGPGSVEVSAGEYTIDVSLIHRPSYPGYIFKGWNRENQFDRLGNYAEFPVDEVSKVTGKAGQELILYAVWVPENYSSLKYELEEKYGRYSVEYDHFDHDYESEDWERINDVTYYVVRTSRKGASYASETLVSTAFVMEYRNALWNLTPYNLKESFYESVKMDILMSQKNDTVEVLDTVFAIVETAADIGMDAVYAYCPALKTVVTGAKYLGKAVELLQTSRDYEDLFEFVTDVMVEEGIAEGKDKLNGYLFGKTMEQISKSTGFDKDNLERIGKLLIATEQSLREEVADGSENIDAFGAFDKAFEIFKTRLRAHEFYKPADNLAQCVSQIYSNIFK